MAQAESEESSSFYGDPMEEQLKPYKFAESIPMDIDIQRDGVWEINQEGGFKVLRATITSKDALSLSLVFDDFYLPENGELYVIGQDRILGAFVGSVNNKPEGNFATVPLPGEVLLLEYYEPLDPNKCFGEPYEKLGRKGTRMGPLVARNPAKMPLRVPEQQVRLSIDSVSHGFKPYMKNFGDSGSCNVDVACEKKAGKRQINSVAMLLTQDGTRVCSGAFINNVKRDGRQLFLTAKHCMTEDPSNFIVYFNYQVKNCGDRTVEPDIKSAHGVTLLRKMENVASYLIFFLDSYVQSDFAVVEIRERIPDDYNVYMAGWDLSPEPPSNVYTIHHPTGDAKKISYFEGTCQLSSWLEAPRTLHWKVHPWTKGSTERGSSGAPLFNSRGLIVGHLHGGSASCYMPNGYDNFGGLVFDWATGPTREMRLRDLLNPTGKHVSALRGAYLAELRKRHSGRDSSSSSSSHHHHRHRKQPHHRRHKLIPQAPHAHYESSMLVNTDETIPAFGKDALHATPNHGSPPTFKDIEVINMIFNY